MLSIPPNDRIRFKIRYRDPEFVVVEKPAGVVTQPGKGHEEDALLNGLFATFGAQLQQLGSARDFGLLHRLDRPTSGLVLVALTKDAYDSLRSAFERRAIRKFYWAITSRAPKKPAGVIRRPILEESDAHPDGPARAPRGGMKLARIGASGKPAVTAYRVLAASDRGALIECRPVTGRLHQVRVHLASLGCPILGDGVYAPQRVRAAAPRLSLHAHRLVFDHPRTGERVDVRSPLPRDLGRTLTRLGLPRPSRDEPHQVGGDSVGEEEPGVGEAPAP